MTFRYVVPWLKCQHSAFGLVLAFQPWDNISECHTHKRAPSVYCQGFVLWLQWDMRVCMLIWMHIFYAECLRWEMLQSHTEPSMVISHWCIVTSYCYHYVQSFFLIVYVFISVLVSLILFVWSVILYIFLHVSWLSSVLFYCNFYRPCVWNKRWWWWWWWLDKYFSTTILSSWVLRGNSIYSVLEYGIFELWYFTR